MRTPEQVKNARICYGVALIIVLLAFVILLPISFSYLEYYEYGLVMRKSTGSVDTNKVYGRGRYALGPDRKFLKYQADAHHEKFEGLQVFSASEGEFGNSSIGLAFSVDVDLTYLLKRDEVGELHRELATSYKGIILARAKDAIKNNAINVTFTQYFEDRRGVEESFRNAVQTRWNEFPNLHCTLDQFHLGQINIPETVAQKMLQAQLQNERNQMESFLQEAQVERELTKVEVNTIELAKSKLLATAMAEANLTVANARVNAVRIVQEAQINGTKMLFDAANISNQEQMTAFMYIRTLQNREAHYELQVSYLPGDGVVRVAAGL
jgi:regulator of protease activity HflC (stomatin/prohibitin superfamily)